MKFRVALAVLLLSVFAVSSAFAQEAAADNAMKVTGELWMGLHMNLTKDTGNRTDLQLDRAQVNFDKKISDMFAGAVKMEAVPVTNVNDYITSEEGDRIYVGDVGYGIFLKEAKIEVTPLTGALSVYARAGITETPMGVFMQNLKGDYWSNLEGSEFVNKYTGEKTYDALIGAGIKYEKLFDAYFTMGHGDGYKNLGGKNAPDYKYAYNGRVTISPIEQLKINGFFSMDNHKPQKEFWERTVAENTPSTVTDDNVDTVFAKLLDPASTTSTDATLAAKATQVQQFLTSYCAQNGLSYATMNMSSKIAAVREFADSTQLVNPYAAYSATNPRFIDIWTGNGTAANPGLYNSAKASYLLGVAAKLQEEYDKYNIKTASYGGGIAWTDQSIKAGFNYFYLTQKAAGEKTELDGDQILDFWANVNLKAFVGMPVAIYTGYSWLMDKDTKINGTSVETEGKAADVTEWYVGAGYEFEEKAAMYLFYKVNEMDISGAEAEKALKFEATLKF